MAMAYLSKHYKIETVGTPFGVSYAPLSSAEGFLTTMSIVRPDPIDFAIDFALHDSPSKLYHY
jgi:hypothetical protein